MIPDEHTLIWIAAVITVIVAGFIAKLLWAKWSESDRYMDRDTCTTIRQQCRETQTQAVEFVKNRLCTFIATYERNRYEDQQIATRNRKEDRQRLQEIAQGLNARLDNKGSMIQRLDDKLDMLLRRNG